MKKILFVILGMFVWIGHTTAEDKFIINAASVPQGGKAYLEIALNNDVTTSCPGYQFQLVLPAGITATGECVEGLRLNGLGFKTSVTDNGEYYQILSYQADVVPMEGTSGTVIGIEIQADASATVGSHDASLKTLKLTNPDAQSILIAEEMTFQITVTDRVILDETSEFAPIDQDDVCVTVNRTIKANEWSTICLPFDMDGDQVAAAFGDDVQFAEFAGVTVGDGAETITVEFEELDPADGLSANWPILIKVTNKISSFEVDDVSIASDEESAANEVTVGKGKNKKTYSFIGTLHANSFVPENDLFLSKNRFYYSAGATAIKAFRGYFEFDDVLAGVSEIKINVGPTTRINGLNADNANETIYDLSGRRIQKIQQRGIYIVNGKKIAK